MDFKELPLKRSYNSYDTENITDAFLTPALKCTKTYKRSVGFFSSGVLGPLMDGIMSMVRNKGKIMLIASPKLSEEDINAISIGYEKKENIINNITTGQFEKELEMLDDTKLRLLSELIANDYLDIKIVVTDSYGMYHDKLGILEDFSGNRIVFYGSPNSSENAYVNNYEKIRIARSWVDGENENVEDELAEFDSLWNGTNKHLSVYDFQKSANMKVLEVITTRENNKGKNNPIKLRDYQEEAINAWVANDYKGFYVMATGTGKTWTAIYSAKKLQEKEKVMIVICAPYKHLVKQWCEDLVKVYPNAKMIMVSSENPNWESQITSEIIRQKYNPENQIIIVSTIASFNMERFQTAISKSTEEKLLIVDEAHRFKTENYNAQDTFKYMLGLSATPFSGINATKGNELMNYFGGKVFSLPIEVALERGFLVPYNYYPLYVYANEDEENRFRYHTQKIVSCFKNGVLINPDLLVTSLRNRLRVISMAEEKTTKIDSIIDRINERDHFVVYCGDGKLFDNEQNKEIRHIQSIKKVLSKHGYKASQFTATENMNERMQLVDIFNKGEISALAAIRCLDEGINIPSIKSALILSSNDDYREFVQRRGRILRTFKDKKYANIYDIIVLPSSDMQGWAKIELRRFLEYGKLAQNWDELKGELEKHMQSYGLTTEDIDVYDYEGMGDVLDE